MNGNPSSRYLFAEMRAWGFPSCGMNRVHFLCLFQANLTSGPNSRQRIQRLCSSDQNSRVTSSCHRMESFISPSWRLLTMLSTSALCPYLLVGFYRLYVCLSFNQNIDWRGLCRSLSNETFVKVMNFTVWYTLSSWLHLVTIDVM